MDLTGYGYRRTVMRQKIPQVTTSATPALAQPAVQLTGEALRLLVKLDAKVALHERLEQALAAGSEELLTPPGTNDAFNLGECLVRVIDDVDAGLRGIAADFWTNEGHDYLPDEPVYLEAFIEGALAVFDEVKDQL